MPSLQKVAKSSFKARYNHVQRCATALIELMQVPARDVTGLLLSDMRDEVEEINRAFHEANAYHNALQTVAKYVPPPHEQEGGE